MKEHTISIRGMSCGHCVAAVKAGLEKVEGVQVRDVRIGSATVAFDESRIATELLADAVREAGYEPVS